MNCQECREELAAYIEGLLDKTRQDQFETHLAECSTCQTELQSVRELMVHLTHDGLAASPVSLASAVMDRIIREQALELRRLKMRRRIRVLGISGVMAAAAAMLFVGGLWLAPPAVAESEQAAKVMAQGAEAVPNASTVHIVGTIRTLPQDNFSFIGAEFPFSPIEVWKQSGDKPKWRVQKAARVAVMDGELTVMLIRNQVGAEFPELPRGPSIPAGS